MGLFRQQLGSRGVAQDCDLDLLPIFVRLRLQRPHPTTLPLALRGVLPPGSLLSSRLGSRALAGHLHWAVARRLKANQSDTQVLLTNLLFHLPRPLSQCVDPAVSTAVQKCQVHLRASCPDLSLVLPPPLCSPASSHLTGSGLRLRSSPVSTQALGPQPVCGRCRVAVSIVLPARGSAAPPPPPPALTLHGSGRRGPRRPVWIRCCLLFASPYAARGLAWGLARSRCSESVCVGELPASPGAARRCSWWSAEAADQHPGPARAPAPPAASCSAWARLPAICQPWLPRLLGETTSPFQRTGQCT